MHVLAIIGLIVLALIIISTIVKTMSDSTSIWTFLALDSLFDLLQLVIMAIFEGM